MNRARAWKIADLIDFEYLLVGEAGATDETTSRSTREVFQTKTLPALRSAGTLSRPVVFRSWLDVRRDAAGLPLPGEQLTSAWQALVVLNILAGLGLGGSVTATLLLYRGDVPVNVPWFIACTLGVQMLVSFVAVVLWGLRVTIKFLDDFRPLRSLIAGLVWAMSTGLRKLPGEQRERLRAVFATNARSGKIYGSLATWSFVVITQIFGVCFNLGIIAVLLAHISFKDIEFGWQSSFVQSDEVAYRIASGMAIPWKWFAPYPHPTLVEVADSHFKYKEARSNTSWWPFLCYAVACYGLFVRGALLVFAFAKWRGAMRRLSFDHEGCLLLYRRLIGPTVHSQNGTATLDIPPEVVTNGHREHNGDSFALIATDVNISDEQLASYFQHKFGQRLVATHPAEIDDPSGNSAALAALTEAAKHLASVIIVVPAKRSPIKAIAIFVLKVLKAVGETPELILLLVGRKEGASFAPVDQEQFTHWKNFVAINGLRVSLEKWNST